MVCFVPIASPSEIAANDFDAVDRFVHPSRPERDRQQHQGDGQLIGQRNSACTTTVGINMKKIPASKAGCRALPLTRARVATDAPHTIAANHCSSPTNRSLPARTIDRTVGS